MCECVEIGNWIKLCRKCRKEMIPKETLNNSKTKNVNAMIDSNLDRLIERCEEWVSYHCTASTKLATLKAAEIILLSLVICSSWQFIVEQQRVGGRFRGSSACRRPLSKNRNWLENRGQCYKTFLGENMDFQKIKKLKRGFLLAGHRKMSFYYHSSTD